MSDLTVAVAYTINSGDDPATGLTLADISLFLTSVNRATGALAVVWDGTQNPTFEITNIGAYGRILTTADLDTFNYFGGGNYGGASVLDADWVNGAVGLENLPIGTAIEFTYTVTSSVTGLPIEGVRVTISTDIAGANMIWGGDTDVFGVARDDFAELPRLDPGTYYFWSQKGGFTFVNPDTEVVS